MAQSRLTISMIGIGLVLFGAGCRSNTPSVTKTTSESAPIETSTVMITSNGVSPSAISVASGTTVSFVNNDSIRHQIASNPHPAHTDLSGFDSLGGILPGTTYTFTFTTVGTWGYHDHLNAFDSRFSGSVTVN